MASNVVSIGPFESPWEATTAKALLEVRGIPSVLVNAGVADLFAPVPLSFVDPVRLEVAAEHRAEAERLIEKLRAARRAQVDGAAPISQPETCLECGRPIARGDERCLHCGWTWVGEETTLYENGPVPDSLLGYIHSPRDSRRFALPAAAAQRYVHWCRDEGLEIHGWEVWMPEMATHRVVEIHERGDGEALLAAIPAAVTEHGGEALFCAYVTAAAPSQEPSARDAAPREAEME